MQYTYRRTWRSEVANSAAVLLFVCSFALVFTFVMLYYFSEQMFPIVLMVVVVGFITLIGGAHIYSAVKVQKNFVCAISNTHLKCICPDPHFGETFRIAIVDLSAIEVGDGRVKLQMRNGSEHWLTTNYGNPTGYFINLLLDANPNSKLVHM